ncbi:MAG: hypothetical protein JJ975_09775 [Bacteroidia bacterium]|nr:hypothetical protein [Bacteroidia bacterium]
MSGKGNCYAFKYRVHDPRLGRFLSVDPLSSDYPWNSSYAFAENKVIRYIELEGREIAQPHYFYENADETILQNIQAYTSDAGRNQASYFWRIYKDLKNRLGFFEWKQRPLSARNLRRYAEGNGGYDVYSYQSLETSSVRKFSSANKQVKQAVLAEINEDFANLSEPGTYMLESQVTKGFHQTGAIAHDFGTAFGSFEITANGLFVVQIDENGNSSVTGTIYYTFRDIYRWHPDRETEASILETWMVDHKELFDLQEAGAANFGTRAYYSTDITGEMDNLEVGDYQDSYDINLHHDPKNDYYGLGDMELIDDFRGETKTEVYTRIFLNGLEQSDD